MVRSRSEESSWVPWDPAVGLRVGALVGGLVSAAAGAAFGVLSLPLVLIGGFAGGALGFWWRRRRDPRRG